MKGGKKKKLVEESKKMCETHLKCSFDNTDVTKILLNEEGKVMCGPANAIKKHCSKMAQIIQGREKASDTAKKIRHLMGGELDEIIAALPSGGFKLTN